MSKKKHQSQKEELFVRKNKSLRGNFLLFFLCFYFLGHSANHFRFDSSLLVIQRENINLQLDLAKEKLRQKKALVAQNSAIEYLLHFNAYLKLFVTEDKRYNQDYISAKNNALSHFNQLSDTSPFKKFAQSEIYFYAATLLARQGEFYNAALEIRKAWNLIEENTRLFPNFLPNNKTRGILKIYLSTVPDHYDWIIRILGFDGDLNHGLRLLQTLSNHQSDTTYLSAIAQEASYLYAYSLLQAGKNPVKSWSVMLKCTQDYRENLLSNYFRGSMALKLNKNKIALKTLSNRPSNNSYESFHLMSYYLGVSKLYSLDTTALVELKLFTTNFKGENYLKSSYEKLSWICVIMGDESEANRYRKKIDYVGKSINNEDKRASRYAKKVSPHPIILKSRLLYDGGYYDEAYKLLNRYKVRQLKSLNQKTEFCYRKGRVLEKLGLMDRALIMYEACSLYAVNSEEYYGAYACLYLGDYHAKEGNNDLAIKFYSRAITYSKNQEYVDSINIRAKAGLKQLAK